MKKSVIISLLLLTVCNINSQESKTFWETLKGKTPETSITFLPVGSHTKDFDLIDVWYTGFNYKSVEFAGFKNSFGDLTLTLLFKRQIELKGNFSLIYGFGVMYGYDGKLQDVKRIPLRNTFLFTGALSPLGGVTVDYKVGKKLSLQLNITPVVIVYGVRYIL